MSENKQLAVIDQRQIVFYGDELIAVRTSDGEVYAALSQMCDALGIDAQGQARRIQRHTVLVNGLIWVDILSTQMREGGEAFEQTRRVRALRVDVVPLWLSGIRTKSVREDVRPKLERFQHEAARVLWQAFQVGELSADDGFSDLLEQDTPSVQAYKLALAVVKMARQQVVLESRLNEQGKAIAVNTATLGDLAQRVEIIEADLGRDDRLISNSEAEQIAQGVKQIAMFMSQNSGRNEYGGVYNELHRRFEIPSYKLLPSARFDEAMNFLRGWWENLTDGGRVPF